MVYRLEAEVIMKHYCIGDTDILLDPGPIAIKESPRTLPFLSEREVGPDPVCIYGKGTDLSFLEDWEVELYTGGYEIRSREGKRFLLRHWMTHRFAFGIYLEELFGTGPIHFYCNESLIDEMTLNMDHLLGSVGIHHRLLQRDSVIVHASYISYEGEGILFTAPSQTGKSTQAELWHHYAGAEVVNGDRALLFLRDGRWYTGGYIASGSSGICKNELLPLKAVIRLAQGSENLIRPLTRKERYRVILSAMETFHWSGEDLNLTFDLADRIVAETDMLNYSCRPDEDAVCTLENYLRRDGQC